MDRLRPLIFFLMWASVACEAASPGEVYWKSVLPNTPVPSAIRDLLKATEGTSVNVGHKGVDVDVGVGVGGDGGTHVDIGHGSSGIGISVGGHRRHGKGAFVSVGHGSGSGVNVITGPHHGNPPVVVTVPFAGGLNYKYNAANQGLQYSAGDTERHHNPSAAALFFLEKHLHPGANFNVNLTTTTNTTTLPRFLSRRETNTIPFSAAKLPEILAKFSISPDSSDAEVVKETLKECEEPALEGETKQCATSLESMVDFSMASLGTRELKAVSTEVVEEKGASSGEEREEYVVGPGGEERVGVGSKLVACHMESYAYAVFYCHGMAATRAYQVEMVGKDGAAKVEAVAVCHDDTRRWDRRHVAFKVLKVEPGTVPVCHFLPEGHVVWVHSGK